MSSATPTSRILAGTAAVCVFALGAWWFLGHEEARTTAPPAESGSDTATPGNPPVAPGEGSENTRISRVDDAYPVPDSGRVTIDSTEFEPGVPVRFDLALSEEATGTTERPVRIASVDRRELKITASASPGSNGGIRLVLDPEWLTPGSYMVEVATAEKSHFPLRRYVIIVR